ncbi:MAG TPA: hypothetical protein VFT50_09830 [Baekduia sp.]|nr:hypothetical protein [Baekduia sp.]
MLERLMRWAAIACTLFVAAGWLLFAIDRTGQASKATAAEIAGDRVTTTVDPDPADERLREQVHSDAREAVDDVNDVLLRPFAAVAEGSSSEWVRRSIPALLALLVYGIGLSALARYLATR